MDLLPLASPLNPLTTTASSGSAQVLFAEGADPQLDFAALLAAGLTAQLAAVDPTPDPAASATALVQDAALEGDAGAQPASPAVETATSMPTQLPLPLGLPTAPPPSDTLPKSVAADAVRAAAAEEPASQPPSHRAAATPAAVAADAAAIAAAAPAVAAATPAAQPIAEGSLDADQTASQVSAAEPTLPNGHAAESPQRVDTPASAAAAPLSHPLHSAASEQPLAPAHPVAVREVAAPVSGSDFADAFARQVVWVADKDAQIAELRLNPPELGPVEVRLRLTGDEASAQFVSPHAEVRSAIESSLVRLREALAEAGITLGDASVSAESFRDDGDASHTDARRNGTGYREPGRSDEQNPRAARLVPARVGLIDVFA